MKHKRGGILFALLLLGIGSSGFLADSYGQNVEQDYYYVDGKKITLPISQRYKAVVLKPGTTPATRNAFEASVAAGGLATVVTSPLLERHGILLLRSKEGVGPTSFKSGMESVGRRNEVQSEFPVYSVGGIDQVLTNEFIVQFTSNASEKRIKEVVRNNNAQVIKKHGRVKNRYILTFPNKTVREALAVSNQLYQDPLVEFSEPNFVRILPQRPKIENPNPRGALAPAPAATPDDPLYPKQWGLHNAGAVGIADADIDAPEAWQIHKGSGEIIVAIIDEGVDTQHPDLKDKIVTPYDATDGDDDQEPNAGDGHGTACAGIAAAITHNGVGVAGVGWNIKILPVRIAQGSPGGGWITSNAIIEDGIRTAVDRNAHVLSNSWGGGSPSSAINSAIDYAIAKNRVVVFAAGNSSSAVGYPANLSTSKTIIAVSATNEWDQFKTSSSSDGETWWGSNFGPEINVAAPGVHIYTTDISGSGGYANGNYVANFNGTSSATPFVAGVAALLLSQNPSWGPAQVRNQLQNTADDLGATGFDNQFGYGRLNAWGALNASGIRLVLQPRRIDHWRKGKTSELTAILTDQGAPMPNVQIDFRSDNPSVATATPHRKVTDSSGKAVVNVKGHNKGNTSIVAEAQGESDQVPVEVPSISTWGLLLLALLALLLFHRRTYKSSST